MIDSEKEMPIGFGLSLAMHEDSMNCFSRLPESEQRQILEAARGIQNKSQMDELVAGIAKLGPV